VSDPAPPERKEEAQIKIRLAGSCLLAAGVFVGTGALNAQVSPTNGSVRNGGFGAPVVKFTEVDGRFGVLVGGRGGWIIDGSVVVGGGGYALANTSNFEHLANGAGDSGRLGMAYGGLELGYAHRTEGSVHLALGMLIGAGGAAWEPDDGSDSRVDDSFFVVEPEIDVVVRATQVFRVALGVGYRLTRGVNLLELGDSDLSGPAGVVVFQFGSF
jgi:hypothetical protein